MSKTTILSVLVPSLILNLVLFILLFNPQPVIHAVKQAALAAPCEDPAIVSDINSINDTPAIITQKISPEPLPVPPPVYVINGELRQGETLSKSFGRKNVPKSVKQQIISQLGEFLDFRRLMPGNSFEVALDDQDELLWCVFQAGPLNSYRMEKSADGYQVFPVKIELECRTVSLSGTINSSLFAAFKKMGEQAKLIYSFADIFGSKIDFNTETRTGDRFTVTVEKYFKKDEFVGYGAILYAAYGNDAADSPIEGFYYSSENTPGSYFDRNGEELGTWFLKSPVPMGRVTSKFNQRRMHPILGYKRPHLGVDLAAPHGTPLLAVADGRVAFRGKNGGYGNQIILDHGNGYRTHYGHLSRFKKGLKKGQKVKKKEVIGYIGSTGLSTGPHVCYRLEKDGAFKNPFALKFEPQSILTGLEKARFQKWLADLSPMCEPSVQPRVVKIRQVTFSPIDPIAFL